MRGCAAYEATNNQQRDSAAQRPSSAMTSRSSPSNCSGACPHCAAKIPGWWVRDYCANCGVEIPQTAQQAEIARLRKAIENIDDITGFDWHTMPEPTKQHIHKQLREIVLTALARTNDSSAPTT